MRVFVDSNIPMYVAGRDQAFKTPCTEFMRAVARRTIDAVSDIEVLQEILYRYHALRQTSIGFAVFETVVATIPLIHPVSLEDLLASKAVLAAHPGVQPRDAIHVAVMQRTGIRTVVSYDQHFDLIGAVARVTPDQLL